MIVSWLWWELGVGQKPDQRPRKPRIMGHGQRGAELGWTTMDCVGMEGMMKHMLPNGARKRSLDVPFFEPLFRIRAIMGGHGLVLTAAEPYQTMEIVVVSRPTAVPPCISPGRILHHTLNKSDSAYRQPSRRTGNSADPMT
jgi:hypothetical protein